MIMRTYLPCRERWCVRAVVTDHLFVHAAHPAVPLWTTGHRPAACPAGSQLLR
jgi:hypothetical protein